MKTIVEIKHNRQFTIGQFQDWLLGQVLIDGNGKESERYKERNRLIKFLAKELEDCEDGLEATCLGKAQPEQERFIPDKVDPMSGPVPTKTLALLNGLEALELDKVDFSNLKKEAFEILNGSKVDESMAIAVPAKTAALMAEVDDKNLCTVCGTTTVFVRGKYPKEPKRNVCPTCLAEKIDTIREITDREYGRAYTCHVREKG